MKFLVIGSEGPGFSSAEEASHLLNNIVLPSFEKLTKLEADKKIIAGGLPAGERTLTFIMDASSNEEVDQILRELPIWGVLKWKVSPLVSFNSRAILDKKDV